MTRGDRGSLLERAEDGVLAGARRYDTHTADVADTDLQQFSGSVRRAWTGGIATLLLVSALAALSRLSAGAQPMATREATVVMAEMPDENATKGWRRRSRVAAEHTIRLTVMLKKQDPRKLFDLAQAVADPQSPQYGQHQSMEELSQWRRPTNETLAVVRDWLATRGIDMHSADAALSATPADDMWTVSMPVRVAEQLLEARYHWYAHPTDDTHHVLRANRFTLPASVAPHVDWVSPTVEFPLVTSISAHGAVDAADEDGGMSPAKIRSLYRIPDDEAGGMAGGNIQAVAAFLEEYVSRRDINAYFQDYEPELCVSVPPGKHGKGGVECDSDVLTIKNEDTEGSGMETAMDMELIMSLAKHVPTVFWYTAGRAIDNKHNEPFLKFLADVKATTAEELPKVFSISYCDWEESVTLPYALRLNEEFAELGLRGVTLLAASGDAGVEGAQHLPHPAWPGHTCDEDDKFIPSFPASSPWVTAVGATHLEEGKTEIAAGLSGGGFSDYFDKPSYQTDKFKAWTQAATDPPPQWRWNRKGRGIPDLAAVGTNIRIRDRGGQVTTGGTSASTPIIAAMVSLINERRMLMGQSPMGFLNPFLYKLPKAAFNDMVSGSNPGCDGEGFQAVPGWDPVSGLGTPRYGHIVAQALLQGGGILSH